MAAIPTKQPGKIRWDETLPPDVLKELEEIRTLWKSGQLSSPKRTLARAISNQMRERGLARVGPEGVEGWLDR
jgi:hypothetical protein